MKTHSPRRSGRRIFGWSLLGGLALMLLGAAGWQGVQATIAYTNTTAFCVSCHEMAAQAEVEWKQSVHFNNASGVRAECADCHVPEAFIPKMIRKIEASNDLWQHFQGSIDTPEKYEARRLIMAEREWARMIKSDSATCRSCHSYDAMAWAKQTPRAEKEMKAAHEQGKTCIECHKGVAHSLPAVPRDD